MTQVPPFTPVPARGTPGNNATDVLFKGDPVPDHKASEGTVPPLPPPTPAAKKTAAKPTGLGTNRPPRTMRKLTEEDREKLEQYYITMAMPVSLLNPDAGTVMVSGAKDCADAWMKLADENASVRRAILAMMEGSAWAGILTAHLPILLVLLPRSITERNPILDPIKAMVLADAEKKNGEASAE